MKRVFATLITFFMLAFILGCSPDNVNSAAKTEGSGEIYFTAIEPVYEYDSSMQSVVYYSNYAKDDGYDSFNEFYNYYLDEYKDLISYGFYLLQPGDNILGWLPDCLYKEFQIFKGADNSDYSIVHEYIMLNDDELGNSKSADSDIADGVSDHDIILSVFLAPVDETVTDNNYRFEFGDNYSEDDFSKYINIYVNETCIATCYYSTSCEITYTWFSGYFKKNLIRG